MSENCRVQMQCVRCSGYNFLVRDFGPNWMSYKATKPGLVSVLYLSMFFYFVGVY